MKMWFLIPILLGLFAAAFVLYLLAHIAGVPAYSSNCEAYLRQHHYDETVIRAVLDYEPLTDEQKARLLQIKDMDVQVMLASNPSLTRDEREIFWKSKSEWVRRGVAENMRITREEVMRTLQSKKDDYWVSQGLSSNPAVPEDLLLAIYNRPRLEGGLLAFASNPNCPEVIRKKIVAEDNPMSNNSLERCRKALQYAEEHNGKSKPGGGYYLGQIHLWWKGGPRTQPAAATEATP